MTLAAVLRREQPLRQCRSEDRPADVWLRSIWMNHLTLIPSRSSMRSLVLADWLLWTKIPVWLMSQNSLWALRRENPAENAAHAESERSVCWNCFRRSPRAGENLRTWINWKRLQNLFSPVHSVDLERVHRFLLSVRCRISAMNMRNILWRANAVPMYVKQ